MNISSDKMFQRWSDLFNRAIKLFGGKINTNVKNGTILYNWLYDDVRDHKFNIPSYYYIPHGKVCLPIPQHWSKTYKEINQYKGQVKQQLEMNSPCF